MREAAPSIDAGEPFFPRPLLPSGDAKIRRISIRSTHHRLRLVETKPTVPRSGQKGAPIAGGGRRKSQPRGGAAKQIGRAHV